MNRRLYSWACYDFANTIFSAIVLTFYFPLYLTHLAGRNLQLGVATTGAMVLAGLIVPWLGALSDRTGKTKFYLVITTLACVSCTGLLSILDSPLLLICDFLAACLFFHASLVFYNALLPVVAEKGKEGYASGIGTGLGYLGVLFSIPIAHLVDSVMGRQWVFLCASILFLIFSLPLFFWVPEREVRNPVPASWATFFNSWKEVSKTVASLGQKPVLLLFLLGNFFIVDAVNSIIFWLIVYITRVFHPPQSQIIAIFLALNFSAFVFGLAAGKLTDRAGSHRTLFCAALGLFLTIVGLGFAKNLWSFAAVSLVGGGFGFAGIWTAGRKRVLELVPPEEVGEYFGLYNLTTKVSVVGSLVFSILADRFGFQAALLSLVLPSGLGVLLLWMSDS